MMQRHYTYMNLLIQNITFVAYLQYCFVIVYI